VAKVAQSEYEKEAEEYAETVGFSWDKKGFPDGKEGKVEEVEFKWGDDVVQKSQQEAISAVARQRAYEDQVKRRADATQSIFKNDAFDFKHDPNDDEAYEINKVHEEFQELLDEEFERMQGKQVIIDGSRNRVINHGLESEVESPSSILSGDSAIVSVEDRVAAFLAKADHEMLEAIQAQMTTKMPETVDSDEKQSPVNSFYGAEITDGGETPFTVEDLMADSTGGESVMDAAAEVDKPVEVPSLAEEPEILNETPTEIAKPKNDGSAFAEKEVHLEELDAIMKRSDDDFPPLPIKGRPTTRAHEVINQPVLFPFEEEPFVSPEEDSIDNQFFVEEEIETVEDQTSVEALDEDPVSVESIDSEDDPIIDEPYGEDDVIATSAEFEDEELIPEEFTDEDPISEEFVAEDLDFVEPDEVLEVSGLDDSDDRTAEDTDVVEETTWTFGSGGVAEEDVLIESIDSEEDSIIDKPYDEDDVVATEDVTMGGEPVQVSILDNVVKEEEEEERVSSKSVGMKPIREKPERRVDKKDKKRANLGIVILVDALIVLVVLLLAAFAILKFAPDSSIGRAVDKGATKIIDVFRGGSSEEETTDKTVDSEDSVKIEANTDKDALVAGQLYNNKNIDTVEYDSGANYDPYKAYTLEGASDSTPIKNNYWTEDDQGSIYYDEAAVATVICLNSELVDYINGGDPSVLSEIVINSEGERKISEMIGLLDSYSVRKLGIGDIRVYGDYFYVWTTETVQETKGEEEVMITREKVYQLAPQKTTMKLVDYEVIE
jgi:hypothetical protein